MLKALGAPMIFCLICFWMQSGNGQENNLIDNPGRHTYAPNECKYDCKKYGGLCALHLVKGCARFFTDLCSFQKVACVWRVPYKIVPTEVCAMADLYCEDCEIFKWINETVPSDPTERIKEILGSYYKW